MHRIHGFWYILRRDVLCWYWSDQWIDISPRNKGRWRIRPGYVGEITQLTITSYDHFHGHPSTYTWLGGGNSIMFHVHPETLGKWSNLTSSFFRWVGEKPPPTWVWLYLFFCFNGEKYGCFQKWGENPKNGWWKSWKTLFLVDDLGGFSNPYFWFNTHIGFQMFWDTFLSHGSKVGYRYLFRWEILQQPGNSAFSWPFLDG